MPVPQNSCSLSSLEIPCIFTISTTKDESDMTKLLEILMISCFPKGDVAYPHIQVHKK